MLRIENVYRPTQEVGGDFFPIAAVGEQTRVIIGDVSGKGLGAAMLVSPIIGALDALREAASFWSRHPQLEGFSFAHLFDRWLIADLLL
jgi:serine phosphatase RsbU (regulator of sigma subunit)